MRTPTDRPLVLRLSTALTISVAPVAALAVNVSSGDGSGSQVRVTSYQTGADVNGNLRSTVGSPVSYQGKVNYSFPCGDDALGRYTSDTTSTSAVSRCGRITGQPGFGCDPPQVNSRVARTITAAPDATGPYSSSY